jgi:hypothetical protein
MTDPATLTRICTYCLCAEDSADAKWPCAEAKNLDHRFTSHRAAVAIVVGNFFDARSERTLIQSFSECCWDRDAYGHARLLSADEVRLLLSGKAKLAIVVQPTPATKKARTKEP